MSLSSCIALKSVWRWLICGWCSLCVASAYAQTIFKIPEQAPWYVQSIESLPDRPQHSSIDSVRSGQEGSFKALPSAMFQGQHWGKRHWLRIRLEANAQTLKKAKNSPTDVHVHSDVDSRALVLSLDKPNFDDVRLYTLSPSNKGAAPQWDVQRAGDTVARRQWDTLIEGTLPYFLLPTELDVVETYIHRNTSTIELYMSVDSAVPVQTQLQFKTLKQAQAKEFLLLFVYGLSLGAVFLVMLFTAVTWRLHADALYGWYSAYALMAVITALCHSGLAHMFIWPVAGAWPNLAAFTFLVLASICLTYFCATMLMRVRAIAWVMPAAHSLLVLGFTAVALFFVQHIHIAINYYFLLSYMIALSSFCVCCALIVARAQMSLGYAWLIAFVPLLMTVVISIAQAIGLIAEIANLHVVTILAFALEATLLGLALQWLARKNYAASIQASTLASIDPLTGFLSAGTYHAQFRKAWIDSKQSGSDLAFFYIRILSPYGSLQGLPTPAMLQRAVRIVRAASRSQDVVGRLDDKHLCVFMPGTELTEDLTQRLSRMVALGLMPDTSDPQAMLLYFRIAASSRRAFTGSRAQVDAALRQELDEVHNAARKPIRLIDRRELASDLALADSELDALWNRAVKMQAQDDQNNTHGAVKATVGI